MIPEHVDFGSPSVLSFVPSDASVSGSVCAVKFLVEAVFAMSDIAKVFDFVVEFVSVDVVDAVIRELSVNDKPDDSVDFVPFSVCAYSSVAISN